MYSDKWRNSVFDARGPGSTLRTALAHAVLVTEHLLRKALVESEQLLPRPLQPLTPKVEVPCRSSI